ncbi:MAG TPA: Fe-S cluster assembly protein SufD [Gemmatimonadales bacterium]|nr:Fe-S cluster assembly protein SufD [Gemmatimonadales bacterium]
MTEQYLADFRAFAANGAGAAPAWLKELRAGAIARFGELGFPTTKQEAWRFTSVAPIAETRFTPVPEARSPLPDVGALERVSFGVGPRIVFLDGRYVPALSASTLPGGVRAGSLARALQTAPDADVARAHLAQHARWEESAFAALNTAFLDDGAFVHVAPGVALEQPLEIVFLASGRPAPDGPVVSHPRSLVVVESGAQAAIIETYAGLGDARYWTNAVTELVVREGARVEHYRVQREGARGFQIATTQSRQYRDSFLALHVLTLGAELARHDIGTVLAGGGAELVLNGLYLLGGTQHADHHTVIDHAEPHCVSHEFFNGVLAERAHGVFNGRIIVRPGAQRTDSKQTNNNLLLSAEARADSQPQLEIYADDVKCTHGSTVGPVDATQLYYLQSRGLDPAAARALLTYGFGVEILDRMRSPVVRAALDRLVRERLA